jgi:hypothetical protein
MTTSVSPPTVDSVIHLVLYLFLPGSVSNITLLFDHNELLGRQPEVVVGGQRRTVTRTQRSRDASGPHRSCAADTSGVRLLARADRREQREITLDQRRLSIWWHCMKSDHQVTTRYDIDGEHQEPYSAKCIRPYHNIAVYHTISYMQLAIQRTAVKVARNKSGTSI